MRAERAAASLGTRTAALLPAAAAADAAPPRRAGAPDEEGPRGGLRAGGWIGRTREGSGGARARQLRAFSRGLAPTCFLAARE